MWTGTPFFALLTRPVMGVSFMGSSGVAGRPRGRIGEPPALLGPAATMTPGDEVDSCGVCGGGSTICE